ncbi:MAG: ATP-binding cassette domain-containing protein [Trueperaceae bacterium]|nr:ATP-binding cassette domain-containing protein [Trueperaceae bacterium]
MSTASTPTEAPVLEVRGLKKYFPIKAGFFKRTVGHVRAVDDVNFGLAGGEILSLVGESGCGKTTTARCIVRAVDPTSGEVRFRTRDGVVVDVAALPERELKAIWRDMQMVFQDPFGSLNPRMNLFELISEPLFVHGLTSRSERVERVAELLELVGLRPEYMQRYPHAFSGGQRQRVSIARALALEPKLIVADEAVSALDVSVQAQVLNLLLELQERLDLTYLFVAHDLSIVKHISHRVAVMYVGRIVELAPTERLFRHPQHPYTEALLSAVPVADPRHRATAVPLPGEVANPANPPSGCYFHPRCAYAVDLCRNEFPPLRSVAPGHEVACHRADELHLRGIDAPSVARNRTTVAGPVAGPIAGPTVAGQT